MRIRRSAAVLCAATTALIIAQSAIASADAPGNQSGTPFLGNVVGNGYSDRVTLGQGTSDCTVSVERGLTATTFAAAVVYHYAVPKLSAFGGPDVLVCPDMGVAVTAPAQSVDDLAVTWFTNPYGGSGPSAYVLRKFKVLSDAPGEQFPSYIGMQDFNGDGRGDIWETSDEGEGFQTFLRSGKTFVAGPLSFATRDPSASLNFAQLDGKAGTDVATTTTDARPGGSHAAIVGFGRSGALLTLESDGPFDPGYSTTLVDANHDGRLDVSVSGGPAGAAAPARIYLNDGRGHFRLAPGATPAPTPTPTASPNPVASPTPVASPATVKTSVRPHTN